MQSLADFLGARDRDLPDHVTNPEPRAPKLSIKERAKEILTSPEYFQSVIDRLRMGELPPQVETLLYHYAYGKPVERYEVKDTTDDVDEMSAEQCENEAMRLIEIARALRTESHDDVDATRIH